MYILAFDLSLFSDGVKWIWSECGLYRRAGTVTMWALTEYLTHLNRSLNLITIVGTIGWWSLSQKYD